MHNTNKLSIIFITTILCISEICFSQQLTYMPDLSAVNDTTNWGNLDRDVRFDSTVVFDAKVSEGAVWLKNYSFTNGKIEVDVKGKNLQGQSFVGIAFHLIDGNTFDAIYFRPFNFFNPERNTHSIQYISMPEHPWQQLRQNFPGKYESNIFNPPNPDDWFHVSIEINYPKITVFVNNETAPSLVVEQLSINKTGSVGLWVGYMSEGKFKNLKITPF
ncbi:MAG: hypothetical protein ACRDE8_02460 [Ginsengibacter sp.]